MCWWRERPTTPTEARRIGRGQPNASNVKLSANNSIAAQRELLCLLKNDLVFAFHIDYGCSLAPLQALKLRSMDPSVRGKEMYITVFVGRSAKTHICQTHYSSVRHNVLLQFHIHFGAAQRCAVLFATKKSKHRTIFFYSISICICEKTQQNNRRKKKLFVNFFCMSAWHVICHLQLRLRAKTSTRLSCPAICIDVTHRCAFVQHL